MRTLLATCLLLSSLPASAAHTYAHAPQWGSRDVAIEARRLDGAARGLYLDLRFGSGRSDVVPRARDLARAAHDFRQLAERRAPYAQLAHAFRHVERRERALARRLHASRSYDGYGGPVAGLWQVRHAMQRVDYALQRYAFDGRDDRHRGSIVYVPRYEYRFGSGYDTPYYFRYDQLSSQHDERRHDRRDDDRQGQRDHSRDDRRDDSRNDRRPNRQQDHRDDARGDQRQDRQDGHAEAQRDDRRRGRHVDRSDAGDERRRPRDPEVQVQEP